MKRTISIKIEYTLDDINLSSIKLTPQKTVEKIVKKDLMELYGGDEGFADMKVKCADVL